MEETNTGIIASIMRAGCFFEMPTPTLRGRDNGRNKTRVAGHEKQWKRRYRFVR